MVLTETLDFIFEAPPVVPVKTVGGRRGGGLGGLGGLDFLDLLGMGGADVQHGDGDGCGHATELGVVGVFHSLLRLVWRRVRGGDGWALAGRAKPNCPFCRCIGWAGTPLFIE